MKYSPTCMWLIYGTKTNNQNNQKQIHFTPPGAVGSQTVKNAICVGQCLSSNLFKPNNYTMLGCESVLAEPGQSWWEGNKEFFYLRPLLLHFLATFCSHYLQFKVWFRGKRPECNEKYNCYLETDLMHLYYLPAFHTPDCAAQSSWPVCIWSIFPTAVLCTPYYNTLSTLMLPQWSIQIISYAFSQGQLRPNCCSIQHLWHQGALLQSTDVYLLE